MALSYRKMALSYRKMALHFPAEKCGFRGAHGRKSQEGFRAQESRTLAKLRYSDGSRFPLCPQCGKSQMFGPKMSMSAVTGSFKNKLHW